MPDVDIINIQTEAGQEINSALDLTVLDTARIKYLGREGRVAALFAKIPSLSAQEKAAFGRELNTLKKHLEDLVRNKQAALRQTGAKYESLDASLPGVLPELGRLHPLTQTLNQICSVFTQMGFSIVEGPEIETEYNNFTGLNIPLDHPSRDAFDTFYIAQPRGNTRGITQNKNGVVPRNVQRSSALLLRSHTSPAQIRIMCSQKPPLAVVVPGKVYRPDATDASHSFMFHQVEGFLVDKNIRFSDLKGILNVFVKQLFSAAGGSASGGGEDVQTRFRPHFFPFTEPSAEVDVSCIICKTGDRGQGTGDKGEKKCPVCHGKGWLEILGCGMIHPNVFKHVGYDLKIYTGFAFGMGVERIAMLKYGISDIRMFFENDLRFLAQF